MAGDGPRLVLTGDPGELTMFAAGRQEAARLEFAGDAGLVTELQQATFGI